MPKQIQQFFDAQARRRGSKTDIERIILVILGKKTRSDTTNNSKNQCQLPAEDERHTRSKSFEN
jgi:hypothetical protein